VVRSALAVLIALVLAVPASAQHEHHQAPTTTSWTWSVESTVFLTGNFQDRKFRDFHQFESQNWWMGMGARKVGEGSLSLHSMLSFEPFTLRDLGSSQAFQTGETFGGAPLIDYQHPHDLIMGLSAAYERPVGRITLQLRGGLVDAPALGPTPFMHRASAKLHPTAPLAHHQLDSSHITHGVVTAAMRVGRWGLEGSAFRGREPDEDRIDLDLGALDSYALRASWNRGGTRAQLSAGWLEEPHPSEPGDITRLTASLEHVGVLRDRAVAMTLAWGQNREVFVNENAWLGEIALGLWARGTGYVRAEWVDKHILEAGGAHLPGVAHAHPISKVGAFTAGYVHELIRRGRHQLAVGADLTGHRVPVELKDAYGNPISTHVFARWSLNP
jgi:hypothetical protein